MEREDVLARLRGVHPFGSKAWNWWYDDHFHHHYDLSGADLHDLQFGPIDLNHMNLRKANLSGTDLAKAFFPSPI
jgi:uncharacterized protein YjbI with pentapeptide repeats